MAQDLIELTKYPSMPAPWSSSDRGEAWVWGDYVAILQTQPVSVAHVTARMVGQKGIGSSPIQYPYAMTVFYRKDRNPHGPSSRPVLVATLERMDFAAAAKAMGAKDIDLSELELPGSAPIVRGLFTASLRFNLGDFEEMLTLDSARRYFLDLIQQQLSLDGTPVKIGAIADVHGHPDTGWPAQAKKASGGCLSVIAVLLLLMTPIAAWAFLNCR